MCFYLSRKVAMEMEVLRMLESSVLIGLVLRLERWWGQVLVGAPEWMDDIIAVVVRVVSGDLVVIVRLVFTG